MFRNLIKISKNPIFKRNYVKINEGSFKKYIKEVSTKGLIWKHDSITCLMTNHSIINDTSHLFPTPTYIDLSLERYKLDKQFFIDNLDRQVTIEFETHLIGCLKEGRLFFPRYVRRAVVE
jgi:hypothetical protein